jgi:hypothetical protein
MELRILQAVFRDATEAVGWYDGQETGLGERFLGSLRTTYGSIRSKPLSYRVIYRNYRRVLLQTFPYAVYFRLQDNIAIVVLLFHTARDPDALRRILRFREKPES